MLFSTNLQALRSEGTFTEKDKPLPYFTIVGPENGLALDGGKSRPDSIPKEELEKTLREALEVLPHEYLRQARAGAAGLRLLSGSADYDVLAYNWMTARVERCSSLATRIS